MASHIPNRKTAMFLTLFLGLGGTAFARPIGNAPLNNLKTEVDTLEKTYTDLSNAYTNRRGLLSAYEAQNKYEQAITHYLIGEYEEAAMILFTLVESDALADEVLRTDSEWYLAHSTFLLGNYSIASDIFYYIIESGESHPFYEDSVRTLLELYGLTRNTKMFDRTYERFILSGRVSTTDAINYSIGKSLFWQNENARSKSILGTIPVTSPFYHQSRYFLGGILSSEGDYDNAISEFNKSLTVSTETADGVKLRDLSILALGRVNLEAKRYAEAIDAYQQLSHRSPYASEQLYELVWCYILQEQFIDALRVLEVFLIAYPEDEKALRLRIIQGNLYIYINEYEQSLVAYERVIRQLTPIQNHLRDIQNSQSATVSFFDALVQDDNEFLQGLNLPTYAYDVLDKDIDIGRSVSLNKAMFKQVEDLEYTQSLLREVSAVIDSGNSIGVFQQALLDLENMKERCIMVVIQSIETQLKYLDNNSQPSDEVKLESYRLRLEKLKGGVVDSSSLAEQQEDVIQNHRDQVREVQSQAKQTEEAALNILSKAEELKSGMKYHALSEDEQAYINELLAQLRSETDTAVESLKVLQSEEVLLRVMSSVQFDQSIFDDNTNGDLFSELTELYKDVKGSFSQSTMSADAKESRISAIDDAYNRTADVFYDIDQTKQVLMVSERRERIMLKAMLKEQVGAVAALEGDVEEINTLSHEVGLKVATNGFNRLESNISKNILNADSGIVRIYWQRKTEVEDEIVRLQRELKDREKELSSKFDFIESKLSED